MKRTRTLFDFNFGKGRDRGMIKTKYRDNMRTTQDSRSFYFLVEISVTCENVMSVKGLPQPRVNRPCDL